MGRTPHLSWSSPVRIPLLRVFPDFQHVCAILAVAGGLALLPCPIAIAQSYPAKPVKMIVPFPPGGSLDFAGRLIAQKLTDAWGQSVVVENKPGAGGNIGADYVAKSPPDGYTILLGALSTHAVNPSLYKSMPYDAAKDFAPITLIAVTPNVLVVNASLPVNNVKEFIAYAKANPGKLAFGSGSNGSAGHLAGELFKVETGTDAVHVPFKGGAPATQALLAGDTQFMFDNLANAMAQVKAGKLKALAVTTAQRSKLVPDLPTMAEAGLPGFDISTWYGFFAPAGTPPAIVTKWNADVTKILNSPEVRDKLMADGAEPAPNTPEQFAQMIANELTKYARIVKMSGAKVD
jgi:tripartite-type tricarboxylate transporter receptor subunit TctC